MFLQWEIQFLVALVTFNGSRDRQQIIPNGLMMSSRSPLAQLPYGCSLGCSTGAWYHISLAACHAAQATTQVQCWKVSLDPTHSWLVFNLCCIQCCFGVFQVDYNLHCQDEAIQFTNATSWVRQHCANLKASKPDTGSYMHMDKNAAPTNNGLGLDRFHNLKFTRCNSVAQRQHFCWDPFPSPVWRKQHDVRVSQNVGTQNWLVYY